MIVVDASALVAMLMPEHDGGALSERLGQSRASKRFASTVSIWEAASAVGKLKNCDRRLGLQLVQEFAAALEITPVAPDMAITTLAVAAAERYGVGGGRPGILNLGDCFPMRPPSISTLPCCSRAGISAGPISSQPDVRAVACPHRFA